MKLEVVVSEASDNLFVKLHPSTVHQLYLDAYAQIHASTNSLGKGKENVGGRNDWNITRESPDDIQFLPLKIDFVNGNGDFDDEKTKTSIYCSYNGGFFEKEGCIQIPRSFHSCPTSRPGTSLHVHVNVSPIHMVKCATTIHVEPLSTSDWELLEIYANELEGGMLLNQLSIVYPMAQLSLKLGRDMVRIKILDHGFDFDPTSTSSSSSSCLRLVADTEIIVTPKPRKKDNGNGNENGSTTPYYPSSDPIRIHPCEGNLSLKMIHLHRQFIKMNSSGDDEKMNDLNLTPLLPCPPISTVWMHPDSLVATVPGWDDMTTMNSIDNDDDHGHVRDPVHAILHHGKKAAVAQLRASQLVPMDCVVLHPHLGYQLGVIPLYDSIRIQVLNEPQVTTRMQALLQGMDESNVSVTVTPITWSTSINTSTDISPAWRVAEVCKLNRPIHDSRYFDRICTSTSQSQIRCKEQFLEAWTKTMERPLYNNTILSHGTIISLPMGNVQWMSYRVEIKEGKPKPVQDKDRLDSSRSIPVDSHCKYFIDAQHLTSIPGLVLETRNKSLSADNSSLINILPESVSLSSHYLDQIISAESKLMRSRSSSNTCALTSNLIVYGERGCGKTHFTMTLAAKLRLLQSYATVYLDCRQLQTAQIRMGDILAELTKTFKQALECQPSLLVLDNLDELIPNTISSAGNGDGSVHQQQGMNPMLVNQAKLLADHTKFLMHGLKRAQVLVMCTCNGEETKLHSSLRSVHTFTRKLKIPSLLELERCNILLEDLEQHGIESSDVVDKSDLAKKTDGYVPRDMKILANRIIAQHRKILLGHPRDDDMMDTSTLMSAMNDILNNYVPINQQMLGLERAKSPLTWSQIGGLFQAKAALSDIILRPVKYRLIYQNAPVSLPRGIMLYGYPGCGKSCIVPALAEECGFNLVTCRGPELLDKYIGASEAKVRQLFEKAYAAAPSILFLDEFDALAPRRGSDNTGVTDRVVNQLLTFLDGVEVNDTEDQMVYIIGASSRPDKIDPALLRPGRLEKHIFIGYQQVEAEWNDLLLKMSRRWNLDEESKGAIQDGTLQQMLHSDGVRFRSFSAADVKGVFDTAHLSAVHDIIDGYKHSPDSKDQEDVNVSKQVVTIRKDLLLEAFLSSRPSLSERDRFTLGETYIPFLGSDEAALEGLGLNSSTFNASSGLQSRKLKTALK